MKKSGSLLQKTYNNIYSYFDYCLVSLAWLLSIWFRITYFTEKKMQFQKDGEYISESIKAYNSDKNSLEYDKLQAIVDMSSVGANADITVSDKFDNIYIYSKASSTKEIDNKPENLENSKDSLLNGKPVEYIGDRYTYIYPILKDDEFSRIYCHDSSFINNR